MKIPRLALTLIFCGVAAIAMALDLWTKEVAVQILGPEPNRMLQVDVVAGVLAYRYVANTGIIFGAFKGAGTLFFIIAILAVPIIIVIFMRMKSPSWTMTVALASVLGGTLGNLYDRMFYDFVRDFIYLYLIDWPIFNLADSFILTGTILLMLEMVLLDEKKKKGPEPEGASPAA